MFRVFTLFSYVLYFLFLTVAVDRTVPLFSGGMCEGPVLHMNTYQLIHWSSFVYLVPSPAVSKAKLGNLHWNEIAAKLLWFRFHLL